MVEKDVGVVVGVFVSYSMADCSVRDGRMKRMIICLVVVGVAASWGLSQKPGASQSTSPDLCEAKGGTTTGQEDASKATSDRPLGELAWLVGRWVDKGEDSTIVSDFAWTMNESFLRRSFQVETKDGGVVLKGTQVIGWDPVEHRIRSWTFDSEGGFGQGIWFRDGNRWLIKKSFVLAEGKRASSISVITYGDENSFRWRSINREIDGEWQPNTPEITVVRISNDDREAGTKPE